ncbi:MAG: tol-pal system YbgF family protein, partial [bacterium]
EKAAQTFERLLNAYLVSPKADDALIMQGLAYMKSGKHTQAGMAFNRLLSMFPNSEYALKARAYLKKLKA